MTMSHSVTTQMNAMISHKYKTSQQQIYKKKECLYTFLGWKILANSYQKT